MLTLQAGLCALGHSRPAQAPGSSGRGLRDMSGKIACANWGLPPAWRGSEHPQRVNTSLPRKSIFLRRAAGRKALLPGSLGGLSLQLHPERSLPPPQAGCFRDQGSGKGTWGRPGGAGPGPFLGCKAARWTGKDCVMQAGIRGRQGMHLLGIRYYKSSRDDKVSGEGE